MRLRQESVDACFAKLWACDPSALEAAAWDRGLVDAEAFWLTAEPFALYCRVFGAPRFAPETPSGDAAS
jgi:hypothetical protein